MSSFSSSSSAAVAVEEAVVCLHDVVDEEMLVEDPVVVCRGSQSSAISDHTADEKPTFAEAATQVSPTDFAHQIPHGVAVLYEFVRHTRPVFAKMQEHYARRLLSHAHHYLAAMVQHDRAHGCRHQFIAEPSTPVPVVPAESEEEPEEPTNVRPFERGTDHIKF